MTIDYEKRAKEWLEAWEYVPSRLEWDAMPKLLADEFRRVASEAKAEQREQDCEDICHLCDSHYQVEHRNGKWVHVVGHTDDPDYDVEDCLAAAIRAQATEE